MKRILVLAIIAMCVACTTVPANATSQACPIDGGNCVGGGPPPVPPTKIRKAQAYDDKPEMLWFFYRFFRFARQHR